jgi:RNA polymerase sigma factor (sigma-70 family)
MTTNPFSADYPDRSDNELIQAALEGSGAALSALVKRHQHYIYNVAQKMVLSPMDAEDITQEVLIKMVTKLAQFKGESNFRTWLYRITFNHFLKMKKKWLEDTITNFEDYGDTIQNMPDETLSDIEKFELKEYIEDAKLGCMNGMLLCLNREQRLVYVLGEIFGIDHNFGADLLDISKDNFRQRLSRARADLYQFMHNKCGLINKNNSCRCNRKTKSFIREGWVDAENMKFNTAYLHQIQQVAPEKSADLCDLLDTQYADLFKGQPFQEKEHGEKIMQFVRSNQTYKRIFELN